MSENIENKTVAIVICTSYILEYRKLLKIKDKWTLYIFDEHDSC